MRNLFRITSCITPTRLTINAIGQKPVLPFYHLVSDNPPAHVKHLYRVISVKEFERDLDFLLRYFTPLDISSLIQYLNGDLKLSKAGFYLSFDDGFRDVKDTIVPILLSKGIPATFFVNPAYVDNADMMYRCKCSLIIDRIKTAKLSNSAIQKVALLLNSKANAKSIIRELLLLEHNKEDLIKQIAAILDIDIADYLSKEQPYLTLADLKKLSESGFMIGGHGFNHPYFNQISEQEQIVEVESCMQWIKNNFQNQPKLFAFPFTDYGVSDQFIKYLVNQPQNICDLSFGTAGIQPDRYVRHLQRIPMEEKCFSAKHIVGGEILYYLAKNTIGYYKKV